MFFSGICNKDLEPLKQLPLNCFLWIVNRIWPRFHVRTAKTEAFLVNPVSESLKSVRDEFILYVCLDERVDSMIRNKILFIGRYVGQSCWIFQMKSLWKIRKATLWALKATYFVAKMTLGYFTCSVFFLHKFNLSFWWKKLMTLPSSKT